MSRTGYNIRESLSPFLEAQDLRIGYSKGFKFRIKYAQNAVVPTLDLFVPYTDCIVAVDLMRSANSGATGFYYGMVHETLLYQYIGGVGTYLGSQPHYVFASGSVFTISNTFIPAAPTVAHIIVSFSQTTNPVTTYMAGYGNYTVIPTQTLYPPDVSLIGAGNVMSSWYAQTSNKNILNLWPYRQHFTQTTVPSAGTYTVTQTIPLDPLNLANSTMIIKVTSCLCQFDNHGGNSNVITYFAVQGGSITVPPYSMLIRNSTSYYNNSPTPLTHNAVAVTGSATSPPAVYFTATITTLAVLARIGTRVEVVCAANDDTNYI